MLQQATSQAGAVTVINTSDTTQDENQLSHVQMGDISTSVTGHVSAEGNSVTTSGLLTSEAQVLVCILLKCKYHSFLSYCEHELP